MDISKIAFDLIIILVPGILSTLLLKNLTISKEWDSFKFSTYTILFSGLNYLILDGINRLYIFICSLTNKPTEAKYEPLEVWNRLNDTGDIPFNEVVFACIIGLISGYAATYASNKKLFFKLAKAIGVSNKFGDENLFYNFFRDDDVYYVYLKDVENDMIYHGAISFYSESDKVREVILVDVDVYSYEGSNFYYNTPKIYLSKGINNDWIIELPKIIKDEEPDEI